MRNWWPNWGWLSKFAAEPIKEDKQPIKEKPMILITAGQLNMITSTLNDARCEEVAEMLNETAEKYNVKTLDEFDEFLSNILQESGELSHKRENMSYSAKRMMQVWPSRFPTLASAQPYAHNPKKLSNLVYGSRMGNVKGTDDGWNFSGGGFIGLTGRETYTNYALYAGYKTPEECAEDVKTSDVAALDSAFWFFYVLKSLRQKSIDDNFIGIVKSINGGTIGLSTREQYYKRCKAVLGT